LATASLHRSIMLQHGYSTPRLLKWQELEVASIQERARGRPVGVGRSSASVCTSCVCASAVGDVKSERSTIGGVRRLLHQWKKTVSCSRHTLIVHR
jgi:hypothetical protein